MLPGLFVAWDRFTERVCCWEPLSWVRLSQGAFVSSPLVGVPIQLSTLAFSFEIYPFHYSSFSIKSHNYIFYKHPSCLRIHFQPLSLKIVTFCRLNQFCYSYQYQILNTHFPNISHNHPLMERKCTE